MVDNIVPCLSTVVNLMSCAGKVRLQACTQTCSPPKSGEGCLYPGLPESTLVHVQGCSPFCFAGLWPGPQTSYSSWVVLQQETTFLVRRWVGLCWPASPWRDDALNLLLPNGTSGTKKGQALIPVLPPDSIASPISDPAPLESTAPWGSLLLKSTSHFQGLLNFHTKNTSLPPWEPMRRLAWPLLCGWREPNHLSVRMAAVCPALQPWGRYWNARLWRVGVAIFTEISCYTDG